MDAPIIGAEVVVALALVITMGSVIHGKMQISVQAIVDVITIIFVNHSVEKQNLHVGQTVHVIQMVYVNH